MQQNSVQKCRACLKISTKTFPLNEQARGCSPRRTYGQLLQEYVKLEWPASDFERLMPQHLCSLCCRELRSIYGFIRQAADSHNKLITLISIQVDDCLREKAIDLPQSGQNEEEIESIDIKTEHDAYDGHNAIKRNVQDNATANIIRTISTNEVLKSKVLEEDTVKEHDANQIDVAIEEMDKITYYNAHMKLKEDATALARPTTTHSDITLANLIPNAKESSKVNLEDAASKKSFVCKICASKYIKWKMYLNHLKNKHDIDEKHVINELKERDEPKMYKCLSCDYTAKCFSTWSYHTRSKHGTIEDRCKCKFCSQVFMQKFDLLLHIKKSHTELIKALKAEAESKVVDSSEPLNAPTLKVDDALDDNEHYASDDNIPLAQRIIKSGAIANLIPVREVTHEEFSDEEFIRNMISIKKRKLKTSSNKSLTRRCDKCGNIYKNYRSLCAHQRRVHISEENLCVCPHCARKCKNKANLKLHINNRHVDQTSKESVKKQPTVPKPKVQEKRFMCPECSYVCSTITILTIHRNRHHTGEKPYKCDFCPKSFVVPYDLKIHRYLHTGERPHKCPICSKGFQDNSHLTKHKRMHCSLPPYQCEECGKRFTQSYNLLAHKRIHLSEKNLNCTICSKVFENTSLLNIHRITENHHDDDEDN